MSYNDGSVLGATTVATLPVLGATLWPNLAIHLILGAFIILFTLFAAFRIRANK